MKDDKSQNPYEKIIDHPHFVSKRYPPMPMVKRAAQFSPFKAMVGYEDEVEEEARFTDSEISIDENRMDELDGALRDIADSLGRGIRPSVTIRYFVPDGKKAGGEYALLSGKIRRIDTVEGIVITEEGRRIPTSRITEITEADD